MKKILLFSVIFTSVNCMEPDNNHLEFTNLSQKKIMKIYEHPPTDESIKKYDDDRNLMIWVFKYKFTDQVEKKQALVDEVVNAVKERDIKERHDLLAISLKKVYDYGMNEKDKDSHDLWGMVGCALDTGNRFGLFVNEYDPRISLFIEEISMVDCLCEPLDHYHPVLPHRYVAEPISIFDKILRFFRNLV